MRGWTAALMITVALLAPAPAAALDPLPPGAASLLRAVKPDPPPEQLTQNTHFVVSDELRHDQFRQAITGLGGVFVGVGTDQNYSMAAWARPEVMVLLDFDRVVVNLHRVYRVAFLESADAEAFIKFWAEESLPLRTRLIEKHYADPKLRRQVLNAEQWGRARVHRRLLRLRKTYAWLKVPHFLNQKEQYDYLRAMWQAGRVFMVRGDLTAKRTMRQLAAALRGAGLTLRVLYISNCEMYFKYNNQYRRNMRRLPTDDRTVVLRTRAFREWARGGKGKLHYAYITQTHDNFRGWLADRRVKSMRQIVPYRWLKPGVLSLSVDDSPAGRLGPRRKRGDSPREPPTTPAPPPGKKQP